MGLCTTGFLFTPPGPSPGGCPAHPGTLPTAGPGPPPPAGAWAAHGQRLDLQQEGEGVPGAGVQGMGPRLSAQVHLFPPNPAHDPWPGRQPPAHKRTAPTPPTPGPSVAPGDGGVALVATREVTVTCSLGLSSGSSRSKRPSRPCIGGWWTWRVRRLVGARLVSAAGRRQVGARGRDAGALVFQELFSKQKGYLDEELDYRKQSLDQAHKVSAGGCRAGPGAGGLRFGVEMGESSVHTCRVFGGSGLPFCLRVGEVRGGLTAPAASTSPREGRAQMDI